MNMYTFCFQIIFLAGIQALLVYLRILYLKKYIFKKITALTLAFYDNLNIAF